MFCHQGVNTEVELQAGKPITITTNDAHMEECSEELLWVDYKNIVNVVDPGKKIYIDDGLISVIVKEKGTYIYCLVFI
jgi:pyruvate kinase